MEKLEKLLAKYSPRLNQWSFLVILSLSIPAVWALFVPGFYGASDDLHIAWLHQLDTTVKAGQIPPRYVPDLSFGFGYPLFNFVFPLPFYVGEFFHLLGFSFVDSIKAVFLLSVPLSGYLMYKFLRQYSSAILALAGAVVYIFTPYRATDIFVRGAIGELFAFIFPPLVALSLVKIVKSGSWRWVGILGFSTAGLILSHNIMAYLFLPFLTVLAFMIGFKRETLFGFALGLLMSLYFWLPAIVESALMKYDTVFNFKDHFPTIKQLITPYFGYGASVPGPGDGMSFFVGTLNLLLVIFVLFLFRRLKPVVIWALGVFFISVFMMNHRSAFLWDSLPFLPYFQFPWRFLSLTTFATSVLVVSLSGLKYRNALGMAIIVGAILLNFSSFRPADFLGRKDDYYLNRYVPVPTASEEYLKIGEEYLRLPKTTQVRPAQVSPHKGLNNSFELDFEKETTFDYYKYYFPGWEARVDGRKVDIEAGEPYGQISFKVESGKHLVEVAFKETPFRMALNLISLLSLLAAITIVLLPRRSHEK